MSRAAVDLTTSLHAQGCHITIFAMITERAHCAVYADPTTAHTVSVSGALLTDHLSCLKVHGRILAIITCIVTGQPKNRLREWVGLIRLTILLCCSALVHEVMSHEVEVSC